MLTILYTTFRAEFPRLVYTCQMFVTCGYLQCCRNGPYLLFVCFSKILGEMCHMFKEQPIYIYLSITTCQVCQLLELNIGKFDDRCMYLYNYKQYN